MANNLLKTNGGSGPVSNLDAPAFVNGANAGYGATINPHGPAFDYYAVDFGGAFPTAAAITAGTATHPFASGGCVEAVNRTIQQLTTIATYEVNADQTLAAPRTSKYATFPVSGTTAGALQTAIQALGTVGGHDLSAATVTATTFGA